MCNTQGAAFCLCAPSRPHFSIIKISCKEGKAGWGCICALRAAAAGPARQAFQNGVSVSAQLPYNPTAVNVRQACRSHAK